MIALLDAAMTRVQLATGIERPGLISLMGHHVFHDEGEISRNIVDPHEGLTLAGYRTIIEYFLNSGYRFITPQYVYRAKHNKEKVVMLTFDDGYYNNTRILPLLEEYDVPISIFVTTGHVKTGQAYWWDVVHRAWTRNTGLAPNRGSERIEEHRMLLHSTKPTIDAYLVANYGEDVLQPVSDLDRPLSPTELQGLADHPLVFIGSHTATHVRLPSLDDQSCIDELSGSRQDLLEITGHAPDAISYPYAAYSAETVRLARACGYHYGIGGPPIKVALPLEPGSWRALQVGRFGFRGHGGDLRGRCASVRSDVSILATLRSRRVFKS